MKEENSSKNHEEDIEEENTTGSKEQDSVDESNTPVSKNEDDYDYDYDYGDEDTSKYSNREKGFLVKIFDFIENFDFKKFKEKKTEKKIESQKKKKLKQKLKDSATTVEDVQNQRSGAIKRVAIRLGLIGFVIILVTGAIILATQDNEIQKRPQIDTKKFIEDTTSFGNIGQKDYFSEQNVLNDKIDLVQKKNAKTIKKINEKIATETDTITNHIDNAIDSLRAEQKQNKEDILKVVDQKIQLVSKTNTQTKKDLKVLNQRISTLKNKPGLTLKNGTLIFPNQGGSNKPTVMNPVKTSSTDSKDEKTKEASAVPEYQTVEVDMSNDAVQTLAFDTGMKKPKDENKSMVVTFDMTTTLMRATLLNGIKAPTLDIGEKNPTPVLMTLDGTAYIANNHTNMNLKDCLLRGVAIGNINTSRAEVFGTHLSCILEADSGKLFKVEHTFPKNQVWIKGEDGGDGIAGLIVDSSGKILSKTAAIGFMQGISNYFSAQNLVTGGLGTVSGSNQTTGAQLGTSMKSGIGSAMSTSFQLIIEQYKKILSGYYPYIDVKGGRKNLTVIFGGGVSLKATPYKELNLENY